MLSESTRQQIVIREQKNIKARFIIKIMNRKAFIELITSYLLNDILINIIRSPTGANKFYIKIRDQTIPREELIYIFKELSDEIYLNY